MSATRSRLMLCAFLVWAPVLAPAPVSAQDAQILVALDSSRSLSAEQSRAAATLARDLLVRLDPTARTSLLTFDDRVTWLARAGQGGAEAALAAIRPRGRYTVLHDGLVEGVRSLSDGGVLVVLTDGKDENSATTLEDVVRLAGERGVRVVTLGVGRVDERTMRRLALLTGGLYAGTGSRADADALAAQIASLGRQAAAERAPSTAATPLPPVDVVATAPPPAATLPAPASDGSRFLLLLGALLATAGVVIGFVLARRRTPRSTASDTADLDAGTKPGVLVPEPASGHAGAAAPEGTAEAPDEIEIARLRARVALTPGALQEVSLRDDFDLESLPYTETIERTVVLTEEVVLTVREPGRTAKSYRLPPGRALDIGRDAARNSLAFHDPTMSTQHLRLALEESEIHLIDLGSTNGVVVQERRVISARLYPGDRFRAGMIEFELNLRRAGKS